MQKQVVVIHGGNTFRTYDDYFNFLKSHNLDLEKQKNGSWKESLQSDLGDKYDVILHKMPNGFNAKYIEWKIWMDKLLPFLNDGVILIGNSLGGVFLAKYLAENDFPVKISQVHLTAAPYDDNTRDYLEEFIAPENLEKFEKQAEKIFLYQSEDDPVVNIAEIEKYAEKLPKAKKFIFEDKGHFNREMKIPELIENIKNN